MSHRSGLAGFTAAVNVDHDVERLGVVGDLQGLPRGPLGYAMLKKLKVYANGEHPHTAQQPQAVDL